MSTTWNTKYGPRRVRHDPPTLEEAIFAARGLTDDIEQQIEIAAGLMEASVEDVRAALKKSPPPRKQPTVAFTSRGGTERSVVVERKPSRRVLPGRAGIGRSLG
jgi:hypothetical protein